MKKVAVLLVVVLSLMMVADVNVNASAEKAVNIEIQLVDDLGNPLQDAEICYMVSTMDGSIFWNESEQMIYQRGHIELDTWYSDESLLISGFLSGDLYIMMYGDAQGRMVFFETVLSYDDIVEDGMSLSYDLNSVICGIDSSHVENSATDLELYISSKETGNAFKKSWINDKPFGVFNIDADNSNELLALQGDYNVYVWKKDYSNSVFSMSKKNELSIGEALNDDVQFGIEDSEIHYTTRLKNDYLSSHEYVDLTITNSNDSELQLILGKISSRKAEIHLPFELAGQSRSMTIYDENGSVATVEMSKRDTIVGSDIYYKEFSVTFSEDENDLSLYIKMSDENGNIIISEETDKPYNLKITVLDLDDYSVVEEIITTRYFADVEFSMKNGTYGLILEPFNDELVNQYSFMEFKYAGKISKTTFKECFSLDAINDLDFEVFLNEDKSLGAIFEMMNDSKSQMRVEILRGKSGKDESISTFTVSTGKSKEVELELESDYQNIDPNEKIQIVINGWMKREFSIIPELSSDIEGHWCEDVITKFLIGGIVFNKTDDKFEPNSMITRSEFAAFLSNAFTLSTEQNDKTFVDVNTEHKLYDEVMTAANAGLINGYPDGTFMPDNNITRQDAAMVINNVCKNLSVTWSSDNEIDGFTDKEDISSYALTALDLCVANGIIGGRPDKKIDPKANLTRAEASIIIERLLAVIESK